LTLSSILHLHLKIRAVQLVYKPGSKQKLQLSASTGFI